MIVRHLGRSDYVSTWQAMREFNAQRNADTDDELWLVEHPPVFTLGQAGRRAHLLAASDIPVVPTDRGGQVTYHGPGQVVAYPLIDLRRLRIYVKELVFRIEESVIQTLNAFGVRRATRSRGSGRIRAVAGRSVAAVFRRRENRRAWHQGRGWMQLSRRGAERRDGPRAVCADRPMRLRRFARRRSRHAGRPGGLRRCRDASQRAAASTSIVAVAGSRNLHWLDLPPDGHLRRRQATLQRRKAKPKPARSSRSSRLRRCQPARC